MKITKEEYCIATKSFPLKFDDGNGNDIDCIEKAALATKEESEEELKTFDNPDDYQVRKVTITYEI